VSIFFWEDHRGLAAQKTLLKKFKDLLNLEKRCRSKLLNLSQGATMTRSGILLAILAIVGSFFVQPVFASVVLKIGDSCPSGYHPDGSSGYCTPFSGNSVPQVVPKLGSTCPSGYHPDGSSGYCAPFDKIPKKNIIQQQGNSCPSGYHPDGSSGYCISF